MKIDENYVDSVEYYYQAMKAKHAVDRERIMTAKTPGAAKRMGRSVEMVDNWHEIKYNVMYKAILHKCIAFPDFLFRLQHSGQIVEWNTWGDTTWGATLDGVGCNALGVQLMFLRDNL